ncbi:MAG: bifunctional nicotinamidase/pyrazinamidase [Saprospirales bacterium]|nr:bifunctional nicotinamidase/pyrazinamidase [Saprospirales bacterium]
MKALILIDLQNDFGPGGMAEIPGSGQAIAVANLLMEKFGCVAAVRDWHPANHLSFAANHPWRKPWQIIESHGLPQLLWPMHCVQNTFGAEMAIALRQEKIDRHFFKGTDPDMDSYGGFFDNAHLNDSGLASYLHERGIEELYLLGFPLEFGVKQTALDGLALGFRVRIVEDACPAMEEGEGAGALEEIIGRGGVLVRWNDI